MSERLALIHTVTGLVPTFKALCAELMPGLDIFNIVDESLLQNTIREERLSEATMRRVAGYIRSAEEAGATGILVTCSSIGPAVDAAQPFAVVPVLRVDEAMADEAIHASERVGVLATLQSTLVPTADLIRRRAAASGLTISLTARVCEGAFEAVTTGDTERHDRLVRDGLVELSKDSDVIVLAQASMARVAETLSPADLGVPVLSSPRSGVMRMAGLLRLTAAA
jgi:Asp/Glu/hydantoin racemase